MVNNRSVLLFYPQYTYPRKNPPMGLLYLAAHIRRYGFKPVLIDLNIDKYSDEKISGIVKQYSPLACGISFMTNQYGECLKLSKLIKRAAGTAYIFVGGPHVSALPQEILRECPEIDFSIIGEGEITALELLQALGQPDRDFSGIRGLCFKREGGIIQNQPRELVGDINSLPFPAWDLIDVTKYSVFSAKKGRTFALLSSRGCPNRCVFCDSHTIFGRRFRARSAQNIFSEILFLHNTYGMTQFDFIDDLITLEKGRVLEFCALLKDSGVPFFWTANARVNTIDQEMLAAMKESGCIRIDVGVESGDPAVRKQANKEISNEAIVNTHRIAKKIGIQIGTFVMVGNLGETMTSVKMTAELLKDMGEDVMVSIACPFPGTELYRQAKEKGYIRVSDWTRYVTAPTYLRDYQPVMVTDTMSQAQILNAYYYLHSFFVKRKFQARYGRYFLINPLFLKEWLLKTSEFGGFARKVSMFASIVKARLTT